MKTKQIANEVKNLIEYSKRLGIPEYLVSLTTDEIVFLALLILRQHMKDNIELIKMDIEAEA